MKPDGPQIARGYKPKSDVKCGEAVKLQTFQLLVGDYFLKIQSSFFGRKTKEYLYLAKGKRLEHEKFRSESKMVGIRKNCVREISWVEGALLST